MTGLRVLLVAGLFALGLGCGGDAAPAPPTGGDHQGTLNVKVGALGGGNGGFSEVGYAIYDLLVEYWDDERGWVELVRLDNYSSTDPAGALTYISPCEAGPDGGGRLGQVTITLHGLRDASGGVIEDAVLPVVASQQFYCLESRDTPAFFDIIVLRSADTGFTDITVDIEHVQCAAKFDCQSALLRDEAGVAQPTLVTGVDCRGAGVDNTVVFTSALTCFDEDDVPVAVGPYVEVFNGFDGGGAQAFHNTATRLDAAFMAPYSRCAYVARALIVTRDGGPRDALFRQGGGHIAWDLDIRMDEAGALVCEGTVAPGYTDVRADHAASPRDGGVRPTREAPVVQDSFLIDNVRRRYPDCAESEALAATNRLTVVAREAAYAAKSAEIARLEALAAERSDAPALAGAIVGHLANARAAGEQDPDGAAIYESLRLAVETANALDRATRGTPWDGEDAVRASVRAVADAIWVLISDAEANAFDPAHHDAAGVAAADVVTLIGDLTAALAATIAAEEDALAALASDRDQAIASHPDLVDAMRACHDGQRELRALRFEHLVSRFPWEQGAMHDPVVATGFLAVEGDDDPQELELLSACAFGNADHIERIAAQVRTSSAGGVELTRGYLDLVRDPASPRGFACVEAADGTCAVLPLVDIPCAVGGGATYDDDGGYIVITAP